MIVKSTAACGKTTAEKWVAASTDLEVVEHNPDHVSAHGHETNVPPAGRVVRLELLSRHLVKPNFGGVRVPPPRPAHQGWRDVHEQRGDLQSSQKA